MDERVMLVVSEWTLLGAGIVACVLIVASAVRAPNKRVLIPASAGVVSFAALVAGVPGMPQSGVEALGQLFMVAFPLLLATFRMAGSSPAGRSGSWRSPPSRCCSTPSSVDG